MTSAVQKDTRSVIEANSKQGTHGHHAFAAQRLDDFRIPAETDWRTGLYRSRDFSTRINEGLSLLRTSSGPADRILMLAFSDPFSFALGRPSVPGVPLWWDANLSFSRSRHLNPNHLFANAELIMVPILTAEDDGCCQYTFEMMIDIYRRSLAERTTEVARSRHWLLLKNLKRS